MDDWTIDLLRTSNSLTPDSEGSTALVPKPNTGHEPDRASNTFHPHNILN